MLELLSVAVSIMAYTTAGFGVGRVTAWLWDERYQTPGPFFAGLAWPLALTAFFPFYLYSISKRTKLTNTSLFKTPEQKVLEYSKAPTKVLAQIIASKILAVPEQLDKDRYEQWNSEDGKVSIRYNEYAGKAQSLRNVEVNDKQISISDEDKKIVVQALQKAKTLQEERRKADRLAAEQLAALEAVESLLLTPEKNNESIV